MKIKIFALILAVATVLLAFASCGGDKGGDTDNCQHTFDTKWSTSATDHWYAATCEHGEIKNKLAKHSDDNQDGKCDVCEYEVGHTHTYESNWTFDEKSHWKKATCLHRDEVDKLSLHSDENLDGSCDVCSTHVHNPNPAGFCTIAGCGKQTGSIDETNLTDLVNAVVFQKYLVNGGNISYDFKGPSNTGAAYVANKLDTVKYIFGKDNYTYVKVQSESTNGDATGSGVYETWHQLVGAEETFGIIKQDDLDLALDMSNVDRLNGYYIALSTIAGDYGVEETLYALYEAAIGDVIGELEVYTDTEGNRIVFKYNYKTVFVNYSEVTTDDGRGEVYNVNYFEVEVGFTYSDNYALTALDIIVYSYTNDPGTADGYGFLEPDVDLDYDPVTDTFVLRENALANVYTINITQNLGARTAENPYPQSKFVPDDFDLYLTETEDEETGEFSYSDLLAGDINAEVREFVKLYVRNCTPVGTSLHFIHELVSFKLYKDGVEIENTGFDSEIAFAAFTYHGEQRLFMIMPKVEGSYKLVIYVKDDSVREVNIKVEEEESAGGVKLDENQFAVEVTESYSWSNPYTFTATQAGTYTFVLPAGVGFVNADAWDAAEETEATDDAPAPYFDFQTGGMNGGQFEIELEANQSIRFYVSASETGSFVVSYSVA